MLRPFIVKVSVLGSPNYSNNLLVEIIIKLYIYIYIYNSTEDEDCELIQSIR